MKRAILIVNFGGPRNLEEIPSFLTELLCDQDVVRTPFPKWLHRWIFQRTAKKRAGRIREDYIEIGGKSPIYSDTEAIGLAIAEKLQIEVLTFHRYLPSTHLAFFQSIENCLADEIRVFPLFPQFCYATTGSIARFFETNLSRKTLDKLLWIKSYANHPSFISSYQKKIQEFLFSQKLKEEEEVLLLFSAHGVPLSFIEEGDPYLSDCLDSFHGCLRAFPKALARLSFQSKFGKGQWLLPATDSVCEDILSWNQGRKHVVIVPITFTSDHIETLFEVEKLYLPIIRQKGLHAHRCPALNLDSYWLESILSILHTPASFTNRELIRKH